MITAEAGSPLKTINCNKRQIVKESNKGELKTRREGALPDRGPAHRQAFARHSSFSFNLVRSRTTAYIQSFSLPAAAASHRCCCHCASLYHVAEPPGPLARTSPLPRDLSLPLLSRLQSTDLDSTIPIHHPQLESLLVAEARSVFIRLFFSSSSLFRSHFLFQRVCRHRCRKSNVLTNKRSQTQHTLHIHHTVYNPRGPTPFMIT